MKVTLSFISEYGEKENDQLRERFNINKDDFPVYKLFKQNEATPVDFKGEIKADELSKFVKANTRLWIGLYGANFPGFYTFVLTDLFGKSFDVTSLARSSIIDNEFNFVLTDLFSKLYWFLFFICLLLLCPLCCCFMGCIP